MTLSDVGGRIRQARIARGLTQAQLALAAQITRATLNQLENGAVTDMRICRVEAILNQVGLALAVVDAALQPPAMDFLRMASISASVSFKERLTEAELLRALL